MKTNKLLFMSGIFCAGLYLCATGNIVLGGFICIIVALRAVSEAVRRGHKDHASLDCADCVAIDAAIAALDALRAVKASPDA